MTADASTSTGPPPFNERLSTTVNDTPLLNLKFLPGITDTIIDCLDPVQDYHTLLTLRQTNKFLHSRVWRVLYSRIEAVINPPSLQPAPSPPLFTLRGRLFGIRRVPGLNWNGTESERLQCIKALEAFCRTLDISIVGAMVDNSLKQSAEWVQLEHALRHVTAVHVKETSVNGMDIPFTLPKLAQVVMSYKSSVPYWGRGPDGCPHPLDLAPRPLPASIKSLSLIATSTFGAKRDIFATHLYQSTGLKNLCIHTRGHRGPLFHHLKWKHDDLADLWIIASFAPIIGRTRVTYLYRDATSEQWADNRQLCSRRCCARERWRPCAADETSKTWTKFKIHLKARIFNVLRNPTPISEALGMPPFIEPQLRYEHPDELISVRRYASFKNSTEGRQIPWPIVG